MKSQEQIQEQVKNDGWFIRLSNDRNTFLKPGKKEGEYILLFGCTGAAIFTKAIAEQLIAEIEQEKGEKSNLEIVKVTDVVKLKPAQRKNKWLKILKWKTNGKENIKN